MNEKIVLTVEQGGAIKMYIEFKNGLEAFVNEVGKYEASYKSLNNLTIDQMARILYEPNSYEVEKPEFEVGQWVTRLENDSKLSNRKVGRVFKIGSISANANYDSDGIAHLDKYIRHATKEEIFWAELGREVGEFKIGDVTLTINGSPYLLETKDMISDEQIEYTNGRLKGFCPAESFKIFP